MIDFTIDPDRQLIEIRVSGLLTLDSLTALRTDPLYDPSYSQLVDCRRAEFSEIAPNALRALADSNRSASDRLLAFVCQNDAKDGILRLYAAHLAIEGGKRRVSIFRTPARALEWIWEMRGEAKRA